MARPGGLELSPYPRSSGLVLASLDGDPPFSSWVDPEKSRTGGPVVTQKTPVSPSCRRGICEVQGENKSPTMT